MLQTIDVIFDGKALIPQNGVQLVAGKRYKLTIQPFDEGAQQENAWDVLAGLVGTVEGPADWASGIDHYLYRPLSLRNTKKESGEMSGDRLFICFAK